MKDKTKVMDLGKDFRVNAKPTSQIHRVVFEGLGLNCKSVQLIAKDVLCQALGLHLVLFTLRSAKLSPKIYVATTILGYHWHCLNIMIPAARVF